MGGFVGYKREVLESIDYSNFLTKAYAFQTEIKYECKIRDFKIIEVPIIFKSRDWGASKISKGDVIEAVIAPWKIRFLKK